MRHAPKRAAARAIVGAMTIADDASILSVPAGTPRLHESAFVASGARVIGDVTLA